MQGYNIPSTFQIQAALAYAAEALALEHTGQRAVGEQGMRFLADESVDFRIVKIDGY